MESASLIRERVKNMRRNAMSAAFRNINLHVFNGKATIHQITEYVAERLAVEAIDVRLWQIGDGIPEKHVEGLLKGKCSPSPY